MHKYNLQEQLVWAFHLRFLCRTQTTFRFSDAHLIKLESKTTKHIVYLHIAFWYKIVYGQYKELHSITKYHPSEVMTNIGINSRLVVEEKAIPM